MAWTSDVLLPRLRRGGPAAAGPARARSGAADRLQHDPDRDRAQSRQRRRTGWSGSRRRTRRPGSTASPGHDATLLLATARAIKSEQEVERMRLANEIAAAGSSTLRAPPSADDRKRGAAALWQGVGARARTGFHDRVELALGFSLVWSSPGIRTFTATGNRPIREHEPTLFEIWVCADGYWCDDTKNSSRTTSSRAIASSIRQLLSVYRPRSCTAGRVVSLPELDHCPRRPSSAAIPASPAIPSVTGSARAPTSLLCPPGGHRDDRGRHGLAPSRASTGPRAEAFASRTTS